MFRVEGTLAVLARPLGLELSIFALAAVLVDVELLRTGHLSAAQVANDNLDRLLLRKFFWRCQIGRVWFR